MQQLLSQFSQRNPLSSLLFGGGQNTQQNPFLSTLIQALKPQQQGQAQPQGQPSQAGAMAQNQAMIEQQRQMAMLQAILARGGYA